MFSATLVLQYYPQGHILLYFFKLLRVFFSFQNACTIFSDLYIPPFFRKLFQFMVFTFLENASNLCIFNHTPVVHSKIQIYRIFWKFVSPKTKEVEETMVWFVKISLFIFCMICHFCKYDGFTVLWMISLLWNHGNLTLKFYQKK